MSSPTITSPQVAVNDIGSAEDFLAAIDSTIKYFNDGDIVEGTIVKVDRDEVLLDIGYKTEGVIPSRELSIKHDVDPSEVVNVGDEVEALVLTKEDKEGRLILSKKRAQYERAWGTIEELKEKDEAVKGTVIEVVKGGLILDIGLRGFLPAAVLAVVARGEHGFARQRRHALRIRQQAAAGAGQRHAAAVPLEQRGADLGLQRLDALGDVGLHGIQLFGGPGDAAKPRDRGKGEQVGQFHLGPPFQFRDGSVL